jgi:hypothetical protein
VVVTVFWPATLAAGAVACDELAGWPVVEELPTVAEGPVGGVAVVVGVAAAGADLPLVVAAVVEEPAEVAG